MFKTLCFIALLFAFSKGSPLPLEDLESRIVGGQGTLIENHPYQVSLRSAGNSHYCGGSIISNRWILTAAHCTIGSADTSVFIWVGTSYLDRGGTRFQSMLVINHKDYNPANYQYDIALVQTSTTIPIDNRVTKIIPMASHFTAPGANLVVTGWGYLRIGADTPNQLQKLATIAISNDECKRFVPPDFVPATKLCTFTRTGQGICDGDSGGPLNENGQLVGLVSWGVECAIGTPDGFERVAPFRAWITQHSGIP